MRTPPSVRAAGLPLPLLLLLLLLLASLIFAGLAPGALAQAGHEHEAPDGPVAFVLRDGPASGRAVVGGFTHFGFALLDEQGAPVPHRDAQVLVTQNGRTLLETASTHEYDGLFSLDVLFHEPGPYEVVATSDGFEVGRFGGVAVAPANETTARIEADFTPAGPGIVEVEVRLLGADGALLPHTDAILETRDAAGKLVGRTHAHIHDAPIRFTQMQGRTEQTLHVTAFNAFATGSRADFRAVVAQFNVPAAAPALPMDAPPVDLAATRSALSPAGESAADGGYTLHGMYDPQPLVGLGNPIRLSGILDDANGTPTQHVDFRFRVDGPEGLVWASETLHEYDGMFEWTWTPRVPGQYEAFLTAERGDAAPSVRFLFTVAPPVLPLSAGPNLARVDGLDGVTALTPAELTFRVENELGIPVDHSEVDVTVYREGEPAFQQFKMHGHAGVTSASIAFPTPGEWLVRVEPFALLPQAALFEPTVVAVEVGEALPGVATAALDAGAADAVREVPLPGALAPVAMTVAALALAATAAARRRRAP